MQCSNDCNVLVLQRACKFTTTHFEKNILDDEKYKPWIANALEA